MTRDRNYQVQGIIGPRVRLGEPAPARRVPEPRSAAARVLTRLRLIQRAAGREAEREAEVG